MRHLPRDASRPGRWPIPPLATTMSGPLRFAAVLPARALLLASVLLVAACGGENVAGPPPTPSTLRVNAGNAQEGVVGQRLGLPVSVTVLDDGGRPLRDVRVTFSAAPGSGTLAPSAVQTNADGRAEALWTLGTQTGTAIATAAVSGVAPATFNAVVLPGPASQVIASPGSLALGVGDALQLQATARDQFGNVLSQIALNWSTLEPAIASVTNGLVTAVATGSARIVVSASSPGGAIADTVPVTVGPPGSSFCGARAPIVPAVGEVIALSTTAGATERCIGADVAGAEFALVALNASTTFGATISLDALALGVGSPPTVPLLAATASVANTGAFETGAFGMMQPAPISTTDLLASRDGGFERSLRLRERRELAQHVAAARERFSAASQVGTIAAQVALPTVGSIISLNAQALSACSQPNNRAGRVVAVSDRAIIVADTANPSGGYTDDEYRAIAATFDTLTYPLDVEYFGEPTNIGGTGRITLFYTRAVNQLTPANSNFVVGGFFFARDLYPRSARNNLPACQSSNEREMMYLLVADPTGQVNGNVRSKADVTRLNRTTVAHELQHLINAGRRLHITPNAVANEEVWLDEGLAHTAEELLYLRLAGFTSRQNLTLQQVAPNTTRAELFTSYAAQNFARWTSFLRAPESQSPYAPNDSLATRGASWHFLRYAAARQGTDEAAFYRRLVNGPQVGIANLTNALPGGELAPWLRDWAVAIFADDLAVGLPDVYRVPAWNFRSILPALTIGGQALGAYPLATRTLPSNVERRITIAGGGSSYLRFTVPNARRALLSVSFNGQAPPANVQLAIVRYR
jgi:hypothetical protein